MSPGGGCCSKNGLSSSPSESESRPPPVDVTARSILLTLGKRYTAGAAEHDRNRQALSGPALVAGPEAIASSTR